ncbi:unnamed protein product [Tuber aestivum]|uniref:NAD-dependent epimerase/dehydratase domain-containing protein n=1 Tax=Tuber aestivum TaxID=59557 RepID=A0A292PTN0_9PEZI|nr:unnamed protein product [Tuber aestivum]
MALAIAKMARVLIAAVNGTLGVLKAPKAFAPSTKRIVYRSKAVMVVITSSSASIMDLNKLNNGTGYTYTEDDWSPTTLEAGLLDPRAPKKFPEKAAWDFVKQEKPNFDITSVNPPLLFGPAKLYISLLSSLNTSNEVGIHRTKTGSMPNTIVQRVLYFIEGQVKNGAPPKGVYLWVDVGKPEERGSWSPRATSQTRRLLMLSARTPYSLTPDWEKGEPNGGYPQDCARPIMQGANGF